MEKFVSSFIYIYICIYIFGSVRQVLLPQICNKFRTELKQIFRNVYIYHPSAGVAMVHSGSMARCSAHNVTRTQPQHYKPQSHILCL